VCTSLGSRPCAASKGTIVSRPWKAAPCIGVYPSFSPIVKSAPSLSRKETTSALPVSTADISGVCPPGPLSSTALGDWASSRRRVETSFSAQATKEINYLKIFDEMVICLCSMIMCYALVYEFCVGCLLLLPLRNSGAESQTQQKQEPTQTQAGKRTEHKKTRHDVIVLNL